MIDERTRSDVKELRRLDGTLSRWRSDVLAHQRTGNSNGPSEAMNLLIRNIKRVGRGFTK